MNIWDSFDFKKIDEEIENKRKIQKENEYLTILQSVVDEKIGKIEELTLEYDSGEHGSREGISILVNRSNIENVYLEGEKFLIVDWNFGGQKKPKFYKFTNKEFYKEYVNQIVNSIIPKIMEYYKAKYIKSLEDSKLVNNEVFNIEIENDDFSNMFEKISSEYGNCETIEGVEVTYSDNETTISFDVDCDNYGIHVGEVILTDRGNIKMNFPDVIEGGDLEYQVKIELENYIKCKK